MLNDFKLFEDTYNFILWLWPVVSRFPKSEKFVLGEKLKQTTISLMNNIIAFNNTDSDKTEILANILLFMKENNLPKQDLQQLINPNNKMNQNIVTFCEYKMIKQGFGYVTGIFYNDIQIGIINTKGIHITNKGYYALTDDDIALENKTKQAYNNDIKIYCCRKRDHLMKINLIKLKESNIDLKDIGL